MHTPDRRFALVAALVSAALLMQACGRRDAAPAAGAAEHLRGAVQGLEGDILTVDTGSGAVRVQLAETTRFAAVVASDRAHISEGSFIGIASVPGPDGTHRAAEVTIFPEAMRGVGEGTEAWDLPSADGSSRMTNGTVSPSRMTNGTVMASRMTNGTVTAAAAKDGAPAGDQSTLTLQYNSGGTGGSQAITIPPGIPVVALELGQRSDVKPGAHVFIIANRGADGALTADRVLVGRNGVIPPM